MAGIILSVLPDADVVTFGMGIRYGDFFGHRGFFHSPFFALVLVAVCMIFWKKLGKNWLTVFTVLFLSALSHGLLDTATNGGLGIALLSPFSNARFFLPWQPIQVSPIGIRFFMTEQGLRAFTSELLYVWAPCILIAIAGIAVRKYPRSSIT